MAALSAPVCSDARLPPEPNLALLRSALTKYRIRLFRDCEQEKATVRAIFEDGMGSYATNRRGVQWMQQRRRRRDPHHNNDSSNNNTNVSATGTQCSAEGDSSHTHPPSEGGAVPYTPLDPTEVLLFPPETAEQAQARRQFFDTAMASFAGYTAWSLSDAALTDIKNYWQPEVDRSVFLVCEDRVSGEVVGTIALQPVSRYGH